MFACLRYLLERLPCTFTMHIRYTASNWVNDVGHWLVRILLTQQRIDSKLFKLLSVNILELMPLRNVHPSSICMIPLIGQIWNTGLWLVHFSRICMTSVEHHRSACVAQFPTFYIPTALWASYGVDLYLESLIFFPGYFVPNLRHCALCTVCDS